MAIEKVGVYRKWLEPVPELNGKPILRSQWSKRRRHRWIVRWYGTNNKRYGKVFKTRKEADKYALEFQNQVNVGKPDKLRKVTLSEFISEHKRVMRGQVAYSTLYDQLRVLKFFENYIGGSVLLYRIQPRDAEAFIASRLASDLSPATVNKDIRTLRSLFNLAIEPRGYLREGQNPFAKIKKRKKAQTPVNYVSVSEYLALENSALRPWWKALISVAYGSGLRHNEILNLTWADIDFENQQINVRAQKETAKTFEWEPKDHENRVVPMSDGTAQLLADLHVLAPEGHPYVFIPSERLKRIKRHQKNGDWTPRSELINNLIRDFDVIRRRAGVKKCTLHDLRRSAITNWANQLPIQVVKQLAGHSCITTTSKYYLSVRSEDLASANRVLNGILAGKRND